MCRIQVGNDGLATVLRCCLDCLPLRRTSRELRHVSNVAVVLGVENQVHKKLADLSHARISQQRDDTRKAEVHNPSPVPRRLKKAPSRSTLSPKGERATLSSGEAAGTEDGPLTTGDGRPTTDYVGEGVTLSLKR